MGTLKVLPLSIKVIFNDPINFLLAIIPTIIALAVYIFGIVTIFKNSDYFGVLLQSYLPDQEISGWVGKLLTAIFIIFFFLIMSWTFVLVTGIIAAPFNSMLSSRIETHLVGKPVTQDRKKTFNEIFSGIGQTFKNELKKIIFIVFFTALAMVLNLFPLFYPVGIFLLALLLAVQFVDYSWSRHDLHFGSCLQDILKNVLPYAGSGFLFLIFITVPFINALVPAFATSYYTVLWLYRQKKIQL